MADHPTFAKVVVKRKIPAWILDAVVLPVAHAAMIVIVLAEALRTKLRKPQWSPDDAET